MPVERSFRAMLSGGDRRSIGAADAVVELVRLRPRRLDELVELLWDEDALVRMRAANALEKVSREDAGGLQRHKASLLGLMAESEQQEVCWALALLVPRLDLTAAEARRAAGILEEYLQNRSSIVKTFAMQGLWELSRRNAGMRPGVVALVRELSRTGTAAMRARGRILLKELGAGDV